MTWPEPAAFLAGLCAVLTLGAFLPLDVGGRREDHTVFATCTTFVFAVLGPRGLLLVWGAAALAFAVRRRRWVLGTAVAVTGGFAAASLMLVVLGGHWPITLSDADDLPLGWAVLTTAWLGTMSVRLALQRVAGQAGEPFDPFTSPIVPHLLPAVAGGPIVVAALALYDRDEPWAAGVVLLWCVPLYAACRFDLHRQRLALQLRRDLAARQRLAAIGEVSARLVHQQRHQAGLMGWSIHRLRRTLGDLPPEAAAAAARDLDVLDEAKELIQAPFESERPAATEASLAAIVEEVCAQLAPKAEQAGVVLDLRVAPDTAVMPTTLREAVFNLVDNALDAAAGQVEVDVTGGDVTVVDDGPGIPDTDVTRLFEPFYSTKDNGSGMGLAIADALVAEVGGQIRHERRDGTTRFVISNAVSTSARSRG
jgi:anti-sigma regulatory factor (Ser/Thr protein kinase)